MKSRNIYMMLMLFLLIALVHASDAASQNDKFIQQLIPYVKTSNAEVIKEREQLLQLHQSFLQGLPIHHAQTVWFEDLARRYKVRAADINKEHCWQQLMMRVNTIPPSLVLAVAAHESAWGHSRFAKQGNNLFGEWCFKRGCGIVPKKRSLGKIHEVRRYGSKLGSIKGFMLNLNSNAAYRPLWLLRKRLKNYSGVQLADGIRNYNPARAQYVAIIKAMINRYKLDRYDR